MKTILCYGDSNTWGSATRPGDDQRYAPHERWPGVLQSELGFAWTVIAEGLPGRTTVRPDPVEGEWLDGSAYLHPCLRSHLPLDAVAIMLGTNDLKQRFGASAADIVAGVGALITIVKKSESGPRGAAPKVLVICPPSILDHHGGEEPLAEMFVGGFEKSLQLAPLYADLACAEGAAFLNAGDIIRSSPFDGIHLDADAHAALASAVADKLRALGW